MITRLEAEHEPHYKLPERYKLPVILWLLWQDTMQDVAQATTSYARLTLLQAIRALPLIYGPWKALKHLFKAAEIAQDFELLAAIAVKIDKNRYRQDGITKSGPHDILSHTKTYMTLRGWRFLRHLGQQMPLLYPEAAIYFLAEYNESDEPKRDWHKRWILSHICFHNIEYSYDAYHFNSLRIQTTLFSADKRAFADTWKRSPDLLFRLMGMARAEMVREFAADALRHDFKTELRQVNVATLQQLAAIPVESAARDDLLVWLLGNAPQFEAQQFLTLGLHDIVVQLLESPSSKAQQYAVDYAKTYARQLPVADLLRLAENPTAPVRDFALQMLLTHEPRSLGMEVWGQLLESKYHHALAEKQLIQHFNRTELTPEWFAKRFTSTGVTALGFIKRHLTELHSLESLGTDYFENIALTLPFARPNQDKNAADSMVLALEYLEALGIDKISPETMQILLLNPLSQNTVKTWFDKDDYSVTRIPMSFWHALAYPPDALTFDWLNRIIHRYYPNSVEYDAVLMAHLTEPLMRPVLKWMADVRKFNPALLEFTWLMKLAKLEAEPWHEFAVDRIIKGFVPADFAPVEAQQNQAEQAPATPIDLQGQTFLFTGTMQTMARKVAEEQVVAAHGKVAGTVSAKLNFLVIGDEGSPLYANGRKGTKQLKAESLIEQGAPIKIISETAFLQMLAGQTREHTGNRALIGAEVLWSMALNDPGSPASQLALEYLQKHHAGLGPQLTDRPVDFDAQLPQEFITLERFLPLFKHPMAHYRELAVNIARFELARWAPTARQLVQLAEIEQPEIQAFLQSALLKPATPANRLYHLDAAQLPQDAVFSLTDSRVAFARQLGMQIIEQCPHYQQPQVLFELTESTDRLIRSFALRLIWKMYRHTLTTRPWQPAQAVNGTSAQPSVKKSSAQTPVQHTGNPPIPEQWPAAPHVLEDLLKRWLFELPPAKSLARLAASTDDSDLKVSAADKPVTKKHISASQAKLMLIDTFSDFALQDADFAALILPILTDFSFSRGKMERDACLVAITRIYTQFPELGAA